jgi:uncharacterized protein
MKFDRNLINKIQKWMQRPEIIIICGARQVGKTTLTEDLVAHIPSDQVARINGDMIRNHDLLDFSNGASIIPLTKNKKILIIDEAQKIVNIGTNLKILYDSDIDIKIIVTGSSSIWIAHEVSEPLTGRMVDFRLYPLSLAEIHQHYDIMSIMQHLDEYMTYGLYPAVVTDQYDYKQDKIKTIANNYLYKDILQIKQIKKPDILIKLLKLLALQIGNEVKYQELANKLNIHPDTVIKYIELLEKTFVIYRLHARVGNIRNEITKSVKIYFRDIGVRNVVLNSRGDVSTRTDLWHIWENFVITEMIKKQWSTGSQFYFWRNYQQQEVDLIQVNGDHVQCREIKYNPHKKAKLPPSIIQHYPNTSLTVIHRDNFWEFLL